MTPLLHPVTLNTSIDAPIGQAVTHHGASVLIGEGLRAIVAERMEQVQKHGYTIARDQVYTPDVLPLAAASYLNAAIEQLTSTRAGGPDLTLPDPLTWPNSWPDAAWKPGHTVANLVKAAALVWAAIDRLEHAPAGDDLPDIECAFCLRPSAGTVNDGDGNTHDACTQCITAARGDPEFFGRSGRAGLATCRNCSCTDDRACMDGPEPCHWVEPDLCSACQRKAA